MKFLRSEVFLLFVNSAAVLLYNTDYSSPLKLFFSHHVLFFPVLYVQLVFSFAYFSSLSIVSIHIFVVRLRHPKPAFVRDRTKTHSRHRTSVRTQTQVRWSAESFATSPALSVSDSRIYEGSITRISISLPFWKDGEAQCERDGSGRDFTRKVWGRARGDW